MLKPLEESERRLILLDAILAAINIDTEVEMRELIYSITETSQSDETDPNLIYKSILKYLQARQCREKRKSSVKGFQGGTFR